MMLRKRYACVITMVFPLLGVSIDGQAQMTATPQSEDPTITIVEHIENGTENTVTMPEALREQLMFNDNNVEVKKNNRVGYRVQVFSDNNSRTAKNEARSKSRLITERFPEYSAYVVFASPYWRLRVGDFRTQEEAREAANEIKKAFPSFGKEVHVVRDRINFR